MPHDDRHSHAVLWRAKLVAWLRRQGLIVLRLNHRPEVATTSQENWSQRASVKKWICIQALQALTILALFGCGLSPANREFQQKIDQTKKQCKASDVRRAVLQVSEKWGDGSTLFISLERWPKEIRDIPFFPDTVGDISPWEFRTSSGTNALGLVIGSGFGHSGMIVCRDTNSVPIGVGLFVHWEDGVYFWSGE